MLEITHPNATSRKIALDSSTSFHQLVFWIRGRDDTRIRLFNMHVFNDDDDVASVSESSLSPPLSCSQVDLSRELVGIANEKDSKVKGISGKLELGDD